MKQEWVAAMLIGLFLGVPVVVALGLLAVAAVNAGLPWPLLLAFGTLLIGRMTIRRQIALAWRDGRISARRAATYVFVIQHLIQLGLAVWLFVLSPSEWLAPLLIVAGSLMWLPLWFAVFVYADRYVLPSSKEHQPRLGP